MRAIRSGNQGRLLPVSQAHQLVGSERAIRFLLWVLAPLLAASLILGFEWPDVKAFFAENHPLHRLRHPAQPGRLQISGKLAGPPGRPTLCLAVHEYFVEGKNGGWRLDWRKTIHDDAKLLTAQGTYDIDPDEAHWEPEILTDDLRIADLPPAKLPLGGRVRAQCVRSGEPVFLDGCGVALGKLIGGCGDAPLTITTGDGTPQRRIDEAAAKIALSLALLALLPLWLGLVLWRLVRSGPLTEALLSRAGEQQPRTPGAYYVILVAAPFAIWLLVAISGWLAPPGSTLEVGRAGYVMLCFVLSTTGFLLLRARDRRHQVAAAMAPVLATPTLALSGARGQDVEAAVEVAHDAPVAPGPLSGRPHAYHAIRVSEVYKNGSSYDSQVVLEEESGQRMPVRDASGQGILDLTWAEVDLRAYRHLVQGWIHGWTSRRVKRNVLGRLRKSRTHTAWVVEERYMDPGEKLYLLGNVQRVAAGQEVDYRSDPMMPVLSGTEESPIIVHAGTERSLLSAMERERVYLYVAERAATALAAALALAGMYLISL